MNLVRLLRAEDVDSAVGLSTAAGWNQTAEDWQRVMRLAPEGCWCVECDGAVVATTTLVEFGQAGWIGMVLTHPQHRRRGFARELMLSALEWADRRGLRTVKLDATEFGKALYESLGFVTEEAVERWERWGECQQQIRGDVGCDQPLAEAIDRAAFGADRHELLLDLAERGLVLALPDGFAMGRVGRKALHLGPCVSESAEVAERLIRGLIEPNERARWYWDLLPSNRAALELARRYGFERQRSLWRMRRGEPWESETATIYAIAGFEFG